MEEDDADFTPTPNTSSNLASLFGSIKKPLQGNPSLTYTAPKAPKSPVKKASEEKSKAIITFSKVVQAYKLENGNYVSQGVTGIVISCSHESHIYEFILYNPNKEHLSQTRISSSFSITLSPNNYVSFYDNNKQNWSLLFRSSADVEQFAFKLGICKFYCSLETSTVLIQDLTPLSSPQADAQCEVEITYNAYALDHEEILKIKEDIKGKLRISNCKFTPLKKGLIGCCENSKRIIIIPYSLSAHWSNEINSNKNLLLEVRVEKVLSDSNVEPKPRLLEDGRESPIDSSAEETSIKARGASIQEALTSTKSQKANLISRMARMGQISLPLKQNVSVGPSDSEDYRAFLQSINRAGSQQKLSILSQPPASTEERKERTEESSIATSSPKPRVARSRTTVASLSHLTQHPEPSQLVSVYQNNLAYHSGINKTGVAYQKLTPVSPSPVTSPSTDPNLSVYVSESRIQAAELRMGMAKISEKLDLVWNKVQNMGTRESEPLIKPALLDSGGILTSIQSLITENESLKIKVEEQKLKIEQQNDKIFQLLELNHKYLEQNTTSHDKQSANESKLRAEMESLRLKEMEVKSENKEALEKIKVLEENLTNAEGANKDLKRKLQESVEEMERVKENLQDGERKKELESLNEKLSKASNVITKLKDKLKEVMGENERLHSVIEVQKEEIKSGSQEVKDSKLKKEEYERTVENLKKQISVEELKTESRVESLSKDVARLEEENEQLKKEIEKTSHYNDTKLKEVLSVLKNKFPDTKEYASSEILTSVENVFLDVFSGTLKPENKSTQPPKETPKVPAPRTSLLNAVAERKPKEDSVAEVKSAEQVPKEEAENEKKEGDSRYKSYDQSWRTTKPPPPPLFDDDDDDDDWLN